MKNYFIKKSFLEGDIIPPSSKSQTMRAILFASIADGRSEIKNFLKTEDILALIEGCLFFKAKIKIKKNNLEIVGVNSKINLLKNKKLNVGNSGIALRFLTSVYALGNKEIEITGDSSIRFNRPMQPLVEALNCLGAKIETEKGFAPLRIRGPFASGKVIISGEDSQPVSSLIIASIMLKEEMEIEVKNPKEKPWVGMTLDWLDKLNVKYINNNFESYKIYPKKIKAFDYLVPTDFSSVLFPIVASLVTNSEITIREVVFDEMQKDQKTIDVFKSLGANIEMDFVKKEIRVKKSFLEGNEIIDVDDFIDSVPVLAVLGCYNRGKIVLKNAKNARNKESDRLFAITRELKKMNAQIEETLDGLIIKKSDLKAAAVNSHKDHRIAMALVVASLGIEGSTTVKDIECINKTYPTFKEDMQLLGAKIV